jgi:uncharacterized Ntn-hydrolase superfamily protein
MTFSLLGRCVRTGMLGAAITTSSIGVGARCTFARAGVGAVLTQHRTDPRLGPLALDLLARGFTAEQTLAAIVAATPHRDWRQLAVLDASGGTATFSGAHVRPEQGEARGTDGAAIANIVRTATIPAAMLAAFEHASDQPLADRLLAGLMAGQAAGGEFRPVVSAALLIVHQESFPYVDLRVDQHDEPIEELARLWAAYRPEADPYVMRAVDPDVSDPPASQV